MEAELKKVLETEYVIECVKDILKDIKEGNKAFPGTDMEIPFGFGEGCYYETKKKLLKDVIYTFFNDGFEDAVKLYFKELKEFVKDEAADAVWEVSQLINHFLLYNGIIIYIKHNKALPVWT